jgi:hypothetical protein
MQIIFAESLQGPVSFAFSGLPFFTVKIISHEIVRNCHVLKKNGGTLNSTVFSLL